MYPANVGMDSMGYLTGALAQEIVERLEAALEEFRGVEEVLAVNENSQLA